jgi:hypothetical protein
MHSTSPLEFVLDDVEVDTSTSYNFRLEETTRMYPSATKDVTRSLGLVE